MLGVGASVGTLRWFCLFSEDLAKRAFKSDAKALSYQVPPPCDSTIGNSTAFQRTGFQGTNNDSKCVHVEV